MDRKEAIEIPFGAKDSELKGWEYTIPEGMEAVIKDCKIIVREKESKDERIRKALIQHIKYNVSVISGWRKEELIAWLEKQGSQNLDNSEKICKDEQNPAWSEENEYVYNEILKRVENKKLYEHDLEYIYKWLKALKERCAWKPSDEQMRALEDVKMRMSLDGYGLCPILQTLINDLKNLKG